MSYEKLGSDQSQLAGLGGGVVSDQGSTLISGNTDGESSLLLGPATLREIQAGVANGNWAIPPADPTANISDTNPIPYWTWTPDSGGLITAKFVESSTTAGGNVVRFTIPNGTALGTTATLTRFIPIPGSAARSFAYSVEATAVAASGTASTTAKIKLGVQFYQADQKTTTGTLYEGGLKNFTDALSAPFTFNAPDWRTVPTGGTNFLYTTAPSDAAYAQIIVTAYVAVGTVPTDPKTIDIADVRLIVGVSNVMIPDETAPQTYGPAAIWQDSGTFYVQRNLADIVSPQTIKMDGTDIYVTNGGSGKVQLSDTRINDQLNTVGAIYSGGAVYPGGSTTRYWNISDSAVNTNGILQARSGTAGTGPEIRSRGTTTYCGFYWDGAAFTITDPLKCFATIPTTSSAANARWDATTGGTLRYSTSSRRWKSDIEDVDAETLAAAKRLKPRHFRSQHQGEEGHRLLGMIAEEVDEAGLDCAVERDAEGQPLALDWNAITAALLARLADAERRIAELEAK